MQEAAEPSPHPKIYEALASAFRAEGTDVLFALLGDANMHWATALTGMGVKAIYSRHEHSACAMATMYANATGKVGVASVTCGPGLTQAMTALVIAAKARIPLVVFSGASPYNSVHHTQYIDQGPLVTATGAHYIAGHSLARMTDYVRDAFFVAKSERRPVVLGVPFDLQKQSLGRPFSYRPSDEFVPQLSKLLPNPTEVQRAVQAIDKARKVVVLAGRGAVVSGAQSACERLADVCGGMLATTLYAHGMFDHHPFAIGISGGYATPLGKKLLLQADTVIAVGTSLAYFTADRGKLFSDATVIQIDTNPVGLYHGRQAASIYVRADAKEGLNAIIERLSNRRSDPGWRSAALSREIADRRPGQVAFSTRPDLIDPRDAVAAIDRVLPKDWEIVTGSGHCSHFTTHLYGRRPENYNVIRAFGAIGNGLPYAMAVATAKPGKPVVLIDGDGSLMMYAQELDTVRRHGLRLLLCILNDGAYGSEIHKMRSDGISEAGAVHGRGDLAAMARGYGLRGSRIVRAEQFSAAFEEFQASEQSELWDIHIDDKISSAVLHAHIDD